MQSSSTSNPNAQEEELMELRAKCIKLGIKQDALDVLDAQRSVITPRQSIFNFKMTIAVLETTNLVRASMGSTYGNAVADFKQPPIKINTDRKPSVSGNQRQVIIKNSNGEVEVITLEIPKAKTVESTGNMWIDVAEIIIPTKEQDGKLHSSQLGAASDATSPLQYANEFDVQSYCRDMIQDALKALGLLDEARTHLEFSMYLMKPDVVLVLKCRGLVFFAAQVKSPELGTETELKDKVFGNDMVTGQIWSYLCAMKAAGNPCPIGAIMTYNKISIVTLGDYTKDEEAMEDDKNHVARIAATRTCLSTGFSPKRDPPKEDQLACETREESPIKPTKSFGMTNRANDDELKKKFSESNIKKIAHCSRVHSDGEVFPCLLQAIEIAYRTILDKEIEKVACVQPNSKIGDRLVFKVGVSSFDWVQLNGKVAAVIGGQVPDKGTKNFYILGKLGEGTAATVYLACTVDGRVCAIKEYYLEKSDHADELSRADEENSKRMQLVEKAETEANRWKQIYQGRFTARAQCLGGKHCLLMPYGRQIGDPDENDASARWQYVSGIRKELAFFAEKGFKYKNSDLRWRHALLDTKNNIFLLADHESLEETGDVDPTSQNKVVYEQLATLLRTMRDQKSEEETLSWLLDTNVANVMSLVSGIGTVKKFFEETTIIAGGKLLVLTQEKYGEFLVSLFPANATWDGLSQQAVVTLCMISHHRNASTAKMPSRDDSSSSSSGRDKASKRQKTM